MPELPSGMVTLLFTDIEGSTQILRRLGDGYAGVLAAHHRLLRAAFAAEGGEEVDTQGDAFFVAFSGAAAALAAAVAAQRTLAAHPWPPGGVVRVRMGLHTGRPLLSEGRYVGLDVHLAARIAAAAHGGQILLSQATAAQVQEALPAGAALRSLGEHRLKDFDQPETLRQVQIAGLPAEFPALRTRGAPAAAPPLDVALQTRPFVDREGERAALRRSLGAAIGGRGGVTLIAGEPGIGKTRLAEIVAEEARRQGAAVLWGACYEGDGAPAFWPWIQLIGSYVREQSNPDLLATMGAGAVVIAQVVPELRERLTGLEPPPSIPTEEARFQLFLSITAFLRRAAETQPLVLVLDDLHWADEPSILLLEFLAREVGRSRLLVLGSYRNVEVRRGQPLARALGDLLRRPEVQRLEIGGLDQADIARFAEATLGHQVRSEVVAALARDTEGNPFFVGEMLRMLDAEERLTASQGPLEGEPLVMPQTVHEVIGRRLDRLSEECNRVLGLAAVIGREFELGLLGRLAALDEDAVLDAIEEAESVQIVEMRASTGNRYRFTHALIRETLYTDLAPTRRSRLHRRVGEAMEAEYATDLDAQLAALAFHFAQAAPLGLAGKAAAYAERAGDQALTLLAYEEAARLYGFGLQVLAQSGDPDRRRRFELLLRLGDLRTKTGAFEVGSSALLEATALSRSLGDPELLARAAFAISRRRAQVGSVDAGVVALMEEALAALGEANSGMRARLLAWLVAELYWSADKERIERLSREAVVVARQSGDDGSLFEALSARYLTLGGPDRVGQCLEVTNEMLTLAERGGDRELRLRAHRARLNVLLYLDEIAAIDQSLERVGALAEALQQPRWLWFWTAWRAARALRGGRFAEAERLAHAARIVTGTPSELQQTTGFLVLISILFREQGRLHEIVAEFETLVARQQVIPALRAALALIYLELGRRQEAQETLEQLATDDFAALQQNAANLLCGLVLLAEVCAGLADAAHARRLYELLLPFAPLNARWADLLVAAGTVAHALGLLAAMLSRPQEAEAHFEAAIERQAHMGAQPGLARSRYEYARIRLARDAPDGRERAEALLDQAHAAAQSIGMPRLVEQVQALRAAPAHVARHSQSRTEGKTSG